MRAGLGRLAPVVAWVGYVLAYPRLQDAIGDYAGIVGLLPVAASGVAWGVAAGFVTGLIGFALVRILSSGLGIEQWVLTYTFDGAHGFELFAFLSSGQSLRSSPAPVDGPMSAVEKLRSIDSAGSNVASFK